MNISEDIKKLRNVKGWTQQQLADFLGTTKSNVSAWESGGHKPSGEPLVKIYELLGKTKKEAPIMDKKIDEIIESNKHYRLTIDRQLAIIEQLSGMNKGFGKASSV